MDTQARAEPGPWRTLVIVAAIAAPLFAVLWLGITLTAHTTTLTVAVVKIVFTIVAVGTAVCGIRWATAAGIALRFTSSSFPWRVSGNAPRRDHT